MTEINENAMEYLLKGEGETGIVITHGFTSSPSYMRPIAKDLNSLGYSVFAPLLPGHGTKESDLRNGTAELWRKAVAQGVDTLKKEGMKTVYCMGHSLGGILSLLVAEKGGCDGVITVAAPIKIYHYSRVKLFSIFKKDSYYTMNQPDGKADMFRYYRTDGVSAGNLLSAIKKAKAELKKVTVPAMIIFSNEDKTVMPESSQIIYNGISSNAKEIVEITGNHHQCITDSKGQYLEKIHKFITQTS